VASPSREEGGRSNAAAWWAAARALRTESWGEAVAGYLFVGPAILLFFTFNAYPVVRGLMIAFSDYRYLIPGHSPFNGVDNWREMTADPLFLSSFGRSLQYTALYFVLNFGVAFLVAVLISQVANQREAGAYRVISYLPVILPIAVALLVWRQLLNPEFGYIKHVLVNWLGTGAPDFLRDAAWAVPVLAIIGAWKVMGTNVLLLLVGLYNINNELYEAAAIDGAAEASLVFYGLQDAGPEGAGRLIGRYAYEVAFLLGDLRWGYAAAINLTVGLTSMIISALVFRALRSGRI
jgi:ABC-type sugar transport system permease subunit